MQKSKDSPQKSDGQDGEENIQNLIEVLEDHRKQCEAEGKYVEAEMAKNRIAELKD